MWRRILPSRAAIVLNSTRSIGPPEVFVIVATVLAWNDRLPNRRFRPTRYRAVRFALVRFTEPGVIAVVEIVALAGVADPDTAPRSCERSGSLIVRPSRRSESRGSHANAGPAMAATMSSASPTAARGRWIPLVIRELYVGSSTPIWGWPIHWRLMASGIVSDGFIDAIRARVPGIRLLTDETDRESYRHDETPYIPAGLPGAVALPTETAQVVAIVTTCAEFDVPIVPRGAGSGLSGGAAGIDGALTIAFTAMDRIVEIDPANLCVVTQPGVINARLKAAVAEQGLFYAPDPASFEMCSIGGNLGTNAGGLCCVKYGQTRDSVLGLEVVMADGSVIRTGGKNVKDVAGYSLTHLIVGSQGTLGLITEATLRLRPTPPPRSTLLAFFPTLESAGDAVAGDRYGRSVAGHAGADGPVHDPGGRRRPPAGPRPRCRRDAHDRVRSAWRGCRRRAGSCRDGLRRGGRHDDGALRRARPRPTCCARHVGLRTGRSRSSAT